MQTTERLILAIDDDPDELFLLGMIAKRTGWTEEIVRIFDTDHVLQWCRSHSAPCIILSDLNLRDCTAWDLLPQIWSLPGYAAVPACVYTGLIPLDIHTRYTQFPNLRAVMEKPVDEALFLALLGHAGIRLSP